MPLNDTQFIQQAVNLQVEMEVETDKNIARQQYAEKLLKLIKEYLKSASIDITGTSNQGAFTGTGKIT
ncbi:hypothetical protein [Chryseobacterium sp. AG363]|uniref:hypothetical protein n=1 Tax=Chryseobacterium sp. AG363 TaxID=2183997 RepID=UPI000E7440E7|nr:hypothetical protein [Chryseobacterium sp. AG363]RKE82013.1 hypothetical protein DEU39_1563 [Chryseobacterium sp. AG363]